MLVPGDAGFEAACRGFNLAHAFRPDLAVLAGSTGDVVAAVRHARQADLTVHVQSTGHGYPHQAHGGMLVNTSAMQSLALDPQRRSARVGAGVRWERVIEEAAPHGLAPLNGSSPDIGVIGYTLGGGMGPMGRTFGFAADRVRGIQLVTADGSLVEVTAESEPELFWALRGGKCAVGIVTELEFDLVSVPHVYGGAVFFAGADAPAVMHAYGAWAPALRSRPPRPSPCSGCPTTSWSRRRCAGSSPSTCAMSMSATRRPGPRCWNPCAGRASRSWTWWA